jgi:SAM-dependent methyltransferase
MKMVSRTRWLEAQGLEAALQTDEDMREWLRVRRDTWARLVAYLTRESLVDAPRRILDVGGKSTSIFLAMRGEQRYAVDPTYQFLFSQHPFLKEVEEYRDVQFIALPIEAIDLEPFDLIFCINMLDHVENAEIAASKMEQLLLPGGTLVLVVDCYADRVVRGMIRAFDVDLPHPHHFLAEDIVRMFSRLHLRKMDTTIFKLLFGGEQFREERPDIPLLQLGRLLGRFGSLLTRYDKRRDLRFAVKFGACYGLALLLASLRRRETPVHPLKKPRLFVFERARTASLLER